MDKKVKPIEYLGENYDGVSEFCNTNQKPMFFTKDGQMVLVAMSIKAFEKLSNCGISHNILDAGLIDEQEK